MNLYYQVILANVIIHSYFSNIGLSFRKRSFEICCILSKLPHTSLFHKHQQCILSIGHDLSHLSISHLTAALWMSCYQSLHSPPVGSRKGLKYWIFHVTAESDWTRKLEHFLLHCKNSLSHSAERHQQWAWADLTFGAPVGTNTFAAHRANRALGCTEVKWQWRT